MDNILNKLESKDMIEIIEKRKIGVIQQIGNRRTALLLCENHPEWQQTWEDNEDLIQTVDDEMKLWYFTTGTNSKFLLGRTNIEDYVNSLAYNMLEEIERADYNHNQNGGIEKTFEIIYHHVDLFSNSIHTRSFAKYDLAEIITENFNRYKLKELELILSGRKMDNNYKRVSKALSILL